jgi:hypothetical protein
MAEELAVVPTPKIPKGGQLGFKEAMGVQEPYLQRKAELQKGITAAEGDIAKATQAQSEVLQTGKMKAQEDFGAAQEGAMQGLQQKLEAEPLPAFIPTKDTAQDLAGLFSIVSVIGMIAGKQNGQLAMSAMNGMLDGYQKGRADLYKKQANEFDKNFKSMLSKHAEFRKEMEDAVKLASTNKEAGFQAAELAATKAGSSIVQAQLRKGDLMGAYNLVKESAQGAEKALTLESNMRQKAADRAAADERARKDREARAEAAKIKADLKSVAGPRSAINERYANTVFRSGNEVLRSLELVEQIGMTTGGGVLGGVVGKGSIPSEVQRFLGQYMTEEQQRNYNTAMSGISLELAYVLNGGYKPDAGTVNKIETLLSVGPNDTAGNAAYKFADVTAKLKAAVEVSPTYTEDQKKIKEMLMQKMDKYATPEVVYQRAYGTPQRGEAIVRSETYPTPQTQAEFDALEPGTEYTDPGDGKVYRKPKAK